jgi:hypothetical protein
MIMTRRRDIIKGFAALPLVPATVEAASAAPGPQQPPALLHDLDRRILDELKILEAALGRVKNCLSKANDPNPLIRNAALLDMRCSFGTLAMATDWAKLMIDEQRLQADIAAKTWIALNKPVG